jgi:hypothetical protein
MLFFDGRRQHGDLACVARRQRKALLCRAHFRQRPKLHANPHHRKAQLVILTKKGSQTFEAAMQRQIPWVNELSEGLSTKDLETTHNVLRALRHKLENNNGDEGES